MLFSRLSAEELESAGDEVLATPITPEEVIEDTADQEEVAEIAAETTADVASMSEADVAVDKVEEQVAVNDIKLEKPEEVTATDVLVSQESLRVTAALLGANLEALTGVSISHESAQEAPVNALQLSTESAKDFVMKIIEQVKAIFAKIVASIKRLYVKVVVIMSRAEKKAIRLKDLVGKKADAAADAVFTEDEVKSIVNRLGAAIVVNGGSLSKNPASDLAEYVASLKTPTVIKNVAVANKANAEKVLKVLTAADEAEATKLTEEFVAGLQDQDLSAGDAFVGKANKAVAAGGKFTQSGVKDGVSNVIAVSGRKAHCVVVAKNGTTTVEAIEVLPNELKTVKVAVPARGSVIALLDGVIGMAKAAKPYADAALKEVDDADKQLGNIATAAGKTKEITGAAKTAVVRYGSSVRNATSAAALQSILAQINGTNALLSYCGYSSSKFGAPTA